MSKKRTSWEDDPELTAAAKRFKVFVENHDEFQSSIEMRAMEIAATYLSGVQSNINVIHRYAKDRVGPCSAIKPDVKLCVSLGLDPGSSSGIIASIVKRYFDEQGQNKKE